MMGHILNANILDYSNYIEYKIYLLPLLKCKNPSYYLRFLRSGKQEENIHALALSFNPNKAQLRVSGGVALQDVQGQPGDLFIWHFLSHRSL